MMAVPLDAKLVSYDVETNGEEIIQFGAIFSDTKPFMSYVKPKLHIDPAKNGNWVHKIRDEHVKDAPSFEEFFSSFLFWLEERIGSSPVLLMGYNNWSCDDRKLKKLGASFGDRPVFTTDLLRALKTSESGKLKSDKLQSQKLSDVYRFHFGRNLNGAHDAVEDALATRDVSQHYWQHLEARFFEDALIEAKRCKRRCSVPREVLWWPAATPEGESGCASTGCAFGEDEEEAPEVSDASVVKSIDVKRRRVEGLFHSDFVVHFPCACKRPETYFFACQCELALQAAF